MSGLQPEPDQGADEEPGDASDVEQDTGWPERKVRRAYVALEVLADAGQALRRDELREEVAKRLPLTPYALSTSSSGAVRAWTNTEFRLGTVMVHAGHLQITGNGGYRITRQGRAGLQEHADPAEHWHAPLPVYFEWKSARDEVLPPDAADSTTAVLHAPSTSAHVRRAQSEVLAAWRSGTSAFSPGDPAWTPSTTAVLIAYLDGAPANVKATLPGLEGGAPRLLAAEASALLVAPFGDMNPTTKRQRIRDPLMLGPEPPGLPVTLSADLESTAMSAAASSSCRRPWPCCGHSSRSWSDMGARARGTGRGVEGSLGAARPP